MPSSLSIVFWTGQKQGESFLRGRDALPRVRSEGLELKLNLDSNSEMQRHVFLGCTNGSVSFEDHAAYSRTRSSAYLPRKSDFQTRAKGDAPNIEIQIPWNSTSSKARPQNPRAESPNCARAIRATPTPPRLAGA